MSASELITLSKVDAANPAGPAWPEACCGLMLTPQIAHFFPVPL